MLALALVAAAWSQDAVTLSAVRYAQDGLSDASIAFHANVDGHIDATIACSGHKYALSTAIAAGKDYPLPLTGLPRGTYACAGTLSLDAADGTSGSMPLSMSIEVLPALKLDVKRADLDLTARRMVVRGDRPLQRLEVEAIGEGGVNVGHGAASGGPSDALSIEWSGTGEAIKLEVTGWDAHDLPGRLELLPWSYAIPHEDVVFATNSAAIDAAEVPKLEKAWSDVERVRARYGSVVPIELFVAGYTDTVGDGASNATLSLARAKALAEWFRKRGFDGKIAYQGFGEGALAVATGDGVDEARNRRAIYLLAAERPPLSGDIPRDDWRTLP